MTTQAKNVKAATETTNEVVVNGVKLSDATKIKYRSNPKRVNSQAWERYEKYQTASTWGEYSKLNDGKFLMADARHDMMKGFLEVVTK